MDKKIYIFDLDDTLTESKTLMSSEMVDVFAKLLKKSKVAIISGCLFSQFNKQIISLLPQDEEILTNLYLFPANGSSMHYFDGSWKEKYSEKLTPEERKKITDVLEEVTSKAGLNQGQTYGPRIEDRLSQITFSALGQEAPVDIKKKWDPDQKIRLPLAQDIQKLLPEFEVKVGGSTSIDITRKGMTKAYAISKIEEHLGITKNDMLFFGDAIFPGGNDYSVKEAGVPSVKVADYKDTLRHIKELVAE